MEFVLNNTGSGKFKRLQIDVIVSPGAGEQQIRSSVETLVLQQSQLQNLHAVVCLVYDRREDVGHLFTIASAIWAPHGDLTQAFNYISGDYSTHRFKWSFRNKVTQFETVQRPSAEEFSVHDFYLCLQALSPEASPESLVQQVALTEGLPPEVVREIYEKVSLWKLQ